MTGEGGRGTSPNICLKTEKTEKFEQKLDRFLLRSKIKNELYEALFSDGAAHFEVSRARIDPFNA